MKRTSVSLIAIMSALVVSNSAHAGISDMINNYFTFRHDQKDLIAPERTLPPKHIVSPYYDEGAAQNWSNYYTRPDLQAVENMDSSSMVMRPNPSYQPPQVQHQGYHQKDPSMGYAGVERRAYLNNLQQQNRAKVYIGEPDQNPLYNNGYQRETTGKIAKKTTIGQPKHSWKEENNTHKIKPRVGDYDYVQSYKSKQNNNAFGDYTSTITKGNEIQLGRSSGYATQNVEVPKQQNNAYYNSNLPRNYIVQPRDTLSEISEQGQIYGNWKMWPLIYDQNRNQIHDPDLIHPGQDLDIPRGVSTPQKNNARKRALDKRPPYSFYDGQ